MNAPVMVFGWGNPSRGDDAIGPLFIEALEARRPPGVSLFTDFQLQVEHALDCHGHELLLFVDASVAAPAPFRLREIRPARDDSFSSHAMSPTAVLAVYQELQDQAPPPAFLLEIAAHAFELGQPPGDGARANLDAALAFTEQLLIRRDAASWRASCGGARTG